MADTTNQQAAQAVLGRSERDSHAVRFENEGIGLLDFAVILAARKSTIAVMALGGAMLAAAVAFLLPNTYTATAVVMPPQKEQSAAAALLGQLGPLAVAAGSDMGLKSPSDLYVGLLGSRTIADHLIDQFHLRRVYKTKTSVETRLALKSHARISAGRDSLIRIQVEDRDPARAASLANAYAAELNTLNKGLAVTDASERRKFLETQLRQERVALAAAEDAVKNQQAQSGLIQPDAQVSVSIGAVAQSRAQIAAAEVALERLKMGATPQNPELARARAELDVMRAHLRKLERGSHPGDALPSASTMPQAGMEYLRRVRDLKYHELLFELLSKQFEAARLDESKAAPSIQVIDTAVPPDKKSGPHRTLITALGGFIGLATAMGFVYLKSVQSKH